MAAPPGSGPQRNGRQAGLAAGARGRVLLTALLAVLLTVAVFWPVGGLRFVDFDDPDYVLRNPGVRLRLSWEGVRWAFTAVHSANWHPLTWISHQADVHLFGLDPRGHHLASLVIHAANALLLFALLLGLTARRWTSFLAALLFALHPLRVESVAWVAERKDVLAGCFVLGALLAWIIYLRGGDPERTGKPVAGNRRWYGLSLALFAAALMSKPTAVALPLLLPVLDWWPLGRLNPGPGMPGWRRLAVEKLPFLLLAGAGAAVTLGVQGHAGATTMLAPQPFGVRLGNLAVSLARYLGKTAWAADLAFFYPHPERMPETGPLLGSFILVALVTAGACLARRRAPWLAAGWLWFLAFLAPMSGIVQFGAQSMADRYTYLPGIGLGIALAWSAARAASGRPVIKWLAVAAAVALLSAAGWRTRSQIETWRDGVTLYRHALEVNPGNWLAHFSLATTLRGVGERNESLWHLEETVRYKPDHWAAHNRLGQALAERGEAARAETALREAIRLRPAYADARNNLGLLLHAGGRRDLAEEQFRLALAADPSLAEVRYNLAITLLGERRVDEALEEYRRVLRERPAFAGMESPLQGFLASRPPAP